MMRVIVIPPLLPATALAELKDWLGITTGAEDAALGRLLAMAVDVCGDFTGLVPIACTAEEIVSGPGVADCSGLALPAAADWQSGVFPADWPGWSLLASRPVSAVLSVARVAVDGSRVVLDTGDYAVSINADGACAVQCPGGFYARYAVRFTAGLAADWDSLPPALRHGIMRLAAHQYRGRDGVGAEPLPPASVTALWRPWRRIRLV